MTEFNLTPSMRLYAEMELSFARMKAVMAMGPLELAELKACICDRPGRHEWSTRHGLLGTYCLVSAALNRLKFSLAVDVRARENELDEILTRGGW